MKNKYLWYTDTHFENVNIFYKYKFISHILKENPKGIFLSGDISNGLMINIYLDMLSKIIKCPIYFILGNHDYHFSSIKNINNKIKKLCEKQSNLFWLTNSETINLNDETALIGTEGWYDAILGDSKYIKYTIDWFLIKDFITKSTMKERINCFKLLAQQSCDIITYKLEKALNENYKTIYILTHFPPWKEATRDVNSFMQDFWLPYNVNFCLGQTIEKIMKNRKKRKVIVLSGHTHTDCWIHVTRNIECKVNKSKYYGEIRNEETLFI